MKIETLPFLVIHGDIVWKSVLALLICLGLWRSYRKGHGLPRRKQIRTILFRTVAIVAVFFALAWVVGESAKSAWRQSPDYDGARRPSVPISVQLATALPFHRSRGLEHLYFTAYAISHQTEYRVRMQAEIMQVEGKPCLAAYRVLRGGYATMALELLDGCESSRRAVRARRDIYTMLGQFQLASESLLNAPISTTATQDLKEVHPNAVQWRPAVVMHLLAGNMAEAARVLKLEAQAREELDDSANTADGDSPRQPARDLRCLSAAASLYRDNPTPATLEILRGDSRICRLLLSQYLEPAKQLEIREAELKQNKYSSIVKLLTLQSGGTLPDEHRLLSLDSEIPTIERLPTLYPRLLSQIRQIGLMRRTYDLPAIRSRIERPILGSHIALFDAQLGYHERAIQQAEKSLLEYAKGIAALPPQPDFGFQSDLDATRSFRLGTISEEEMNELIQENSTKRKKIRYEWNEIQRRSHKGMLALHLLLAVEKGKVGESSAAQGHLNLAAGIHKEYPIYNFERIEAGVILGQSSPLELANNFSSKYDHEQNPVYSDKIPPEADNFRWKTSYSFRRPLQTLDSMAGDYAVAEIFESEVWLAELRESRDRWDKALADPKRSLLYSLLSTIE